jgi:hypothetical protein
MKVCPNIKWTIFVDCYYYKRHYSLMYFFVLYVRKCVYGFAILTGHVSMWTIFTGPMLPEDEKLIIIYTAGITGHVFMWTIFTGPLQPENEAVRVSIIQSWEWFFGQTTTVCVRSFLTGTWMESMMSAEYEAVRVSIKCMSVTS